MDIEKLILAKAICAKRNRYYLVMQIALAITVYLVTIPAYLMVKDCLLPARRLLVTNFVIIIQMVHLRIIQRINTLKKIKKEEEVPVGGGYLLLVLRLPMLLVVVPMEMHSLLLYVWKNKNKKQYQNPLLY